VLRLRRYERISVQNRRFRSNVTQLTFYAAFNFDKLAYSNLPSMMKVLVFSFITLSDEMHARVISNQINSSLTTWPVIKLSGRIDHYHCRSAGFCTLPITDPQHFEISPIRHAPYISVFVVAGSQASSLYICNFFNLCKTIGTDLQLQIRAI